MPKTKQCLRPSPKNPSKKVPRPPDKKRVPVRRSKLPAVLPRLKMKEPPAIEFTAVPVKILGTTFVARLPTTQYNRFCDWSREGFDAERNLTLTLTRALAFEVKEEE